MNVASARRLQLAYAPSSVSATERAIYSTPTVHSTKIAVSNTLSPSATSHCRCGSCARASLRDVRTPLGSAVKLRKLSPAHANGGVLHLIEAGNDDTDEHSSLQLLRATVYHRIEDSHCALQHGHWKDQAAVITRRFAGSRCFKTLGRCLTRPWPS